MPLTFPYLVHEATHLGLEDGMRQNMWMLMGRVF